MAAPPVVALEIGTSKTMALVGELREDNYIMITGSGETVSKGVRKGDVIDVDGAAESVKAALEMAEEIGKVTIRQVYLSFAGGHIQSLTNRGTVPIVSRDRVISDEDVAQVCQVARAVSLSQEREIFHSLSQQFEIDDHERVMRPEGMAGARLSHDMLILHCLRNRLETTVRMVRSIPIHVEDVVFSGLCSALAVLTPEQKKSGVVAVDLGAGKTDYVVYAGNVAVSAGVVAVGGRPCDQRHRVGVQHFDQPGGAVEMQLRQRAGRARAETAAGLAAAGGGLPGAVGKFERAADGGGGARGRDAGHCPRPPGEGRRVLAPRGRRGVNRGRRAPEERRRSGREGLWPALRDGLPAGRDRNGHRVGRSGVRDVRRPGAARLQGAGGNAPHADAEALAERGSRTMNRGVDRHG